MRNSTLSLALSLCSIAAASLTADERDALAALLQSAVERPKS